MTEDAGIKIGINSHRNEYMEFFSTRGQDIL